MNMGGTVEVGKGFDEYCEGFRGVWISETEVGVMRSKEEVLTR